MLSWGRSLDKPTWISSHRETFEVSLRSPWGGWSSQCVFNQKGSSGGHTNTRCWWRCSIHLTRCESDSAPHSHCPAALHHPPHTLTLGHLFLHTFPPRSRLFLWSVLLCECVYMREWAACLCVCWSSVCVSMHRTECLRHRDPTGTWTIRQLVLYKCTLYLFVFVLELDWSLSGKNKLWISFTRMSSLLAVCVLALTCSHELVENAAESWCFSTYSDWGFAALVCHEPTVRAQSGNRCGEGGETRGRRWEPALQDSALIYFSQTFYIFFKQPQTVRCPF